MAHKILLLGGTTEAREIAEVLANCEESDAIISLAGRTTFPASFPIPVRIGGFGGVHGLVGYLKHHRIALVINATHPYATQMWANAVAACKKAGVPLVSFNRPQWEPTAGDIWTPVPNTSTVVARLKRRKPRNVFLPLGQKELLAFEAAPQHNYLIRSIEKFPKPLNVPRATYIEARPPFAKAAEMALLQSNATDVMVVKNSGGSASLAKLQAARELGIEVMMIGRPPLPNVECVSSVAQVLQATVHELSLLAKRVA